jgi:hypothetical protein
VVALPPGDQAVALRFADLEEILPGELDRGLDGLGPAGEQIDPVDALGCGLDQQVGERLGGVGGEEAGMGEGDPVELVVDRGAHVGSEWPRQDTAAPPEPSR